MTKTITLSERIALIRACQDDPLIHAELGKVLEGVRRLQAALAFYADPKSYDEEGLPGRVVFEEGDSGPYDFEPDLGATARVALHLPPPDDDIWYPDRDL